MTCLHPDLVTIAEAVRILSATSYLVLGHTRDQSEGMGDANDDLPPLASCLADDLYERLYVRPSEPGGPRGAAGLIQRDFLAALSAANGGRGTWESEWTVRRITGDGQVVVGRNELELWATTREVRTATGQITPGERCRICVPKEMRYLMKGFFYVFGNGEEEELALDPSAAVEPQCRFYWHLTSNVAAPFIAAATSILNAISIPFRLKVLRSPNDYRRADAGVLYIGRRLMPNIGDAIRRIHEAVASGLRPETPLLTYRLADGLGLAEAVPSCTSYGQQRCRLIARSFWQSFVAGHDRDDRLHTLAAAFQHDSLDPRHPYLAPESTLESIVPVMQAFRVRPKPVGDGRIKATTGESSSSGGTPLSPLDAAVLVGRSLCRAAQWDEAGRLCNWMGRTTLTAAGSGAILLAASALGPDLYGGSAGVALFLAQLYTLAGVALFRRTALGAIDRSILQFQKSPGKSPAPLSFFVGRLGMAYAAHRVAALTGMDELHCQAEAFLDRLEDEIDEPHVYDVIGGNAGAIPALLR